MNSSLRIHQLLKNEIPTTTELFAATVYDGGLAEARTHFDESINGPSDTFFTHVDGNLAGFVTIRWESHNEQFKREEFRLFTIYWCLAITEGKGLPMRCWMRPNSSSAHVQLKRASALGFSMHMVRLSDSMLSGVTSQTAGECANGTGRLNFGSS